MRILVAQSGGPTSVINASLAGVIERSHALGYEVFGGLHGMEGILESKIVKLVPGKVELELLKNTPGAYLGSCRYNLPEPPNKVYDDFFEIVKSNKIDGFLYIGGNDSMDSVDKITRESKRRNLPLMVGGIPKTVDNDLILTDHCPGYPSAAKFLNVVACEFVMDSNAYSTPSICVMEIMGRDSGWLAASLKVAEEMVEGLKVITYIPERPVSEERILDEVASVKQKFLLVAVSEGIKNEDGKYFSALEMKDAFGHPKLGGAGERVTEMVKKVGKTKFVNPSFLQRSASHLVSEVDLKEAFMVGSDGVDAIANGKCGFFVAIERNAGDAYSSKTRIIPINGIANRVKNVPDDFTDRNIIDYVKPLLGKLTEYAWRTDWV